MPAISNDHPIFSQFRGYSGDQQAGEVVDWIGAKHLVAWVTAEITAPFTNHALPVPPVDNEYLEWVDLLDAVHTARDRFVMMELGAGFGKWGTRGALAARQRGIADIQIVFVEAEPTHANWIREAVALNGIEQQCRIVEAAVSYGRDTVAFAIGGLGSNATNWYGQFVPTTFAADIATDKVYGGRPVFLAQNGYEVIRVPATKVQAVAPQGMIDLIDMDLQEVELDFVRNEMGWIQTHVRRLHIETHRNAIAKEIRRTLSACGWRARWDFGEGENHTEFGIITFDPGTGLQGWSNPRFE
jgi:FkbM family methyltransferase